MNKSHTTLATLIGVPLDLGAKNLGVDIGPNAFRYQNIIDKLASANLEVADLGDLTVGERKELAVGNPRAKYLKEIVRVNEELAGKTEQILRDQRKAIILGGDHSVNLGAVSGASVALNGQLGLIYFDAHGDMNTEDTTLSGNIHGMHLASLLGYGTPELKDLHGKQVKIDKANLLHIGGSDFDEAEWQFTQDEGLHMYTLLDVLSEGLRPLLQAIESLASQVPNIWISLDLDCIDQVYAPGAGMPNAKGLTYREIAVLAEFVGKTCNVVGIDVVEYNPLQDIDNKTAELGIELIARFLGKDYSWYSNYMAHNKLT